MWVEEGATTAAQRAKFEVDRLLATSEPELLNEDIYKELVNIMKAHARRHGVTELPFADPVGYYGT
jgi:trimethylamine:corrinoid methyltransferase-like protein